ncbi:MAG TPA: PEP-CTERM sorting domain-containing protein [Thermoguttaceae bacterium]
MLRVLRCVFVVVFCVCMDVGFGPAKAGDAFYFVNPSGWTTSSPGSTYQEWDVFASATGNVPDFGHVTTSAGLDSPLASVASPGFVTGSNNFYSFSTDYGISANLFNHGGSSGAGGYPAGYGTHVIIQTASTLGDPLGVLLGSMEIVGFGGDPIPGGDNASALQSAMLWTGEVMSSFGIVTQEERLWEFFLPGYTDDFQVRWQNQVHSQFKQLRVDTMIAQTAFPLISVPEPNMFCLLAMGAVSLGIFRLSRRRLCRRSIKETHAANWPAVC